MEGVGGILHCIIIKIRMESGQSSKQLAGQRQSGNMKTYPKRNVGNAEGWVENITDLLIQLSVIALEVGGGADVHLHFPLEILLHD